MKIASNYTFLFLNNEKKVLLGPPPPKKRLSDTNVRDTATRRTIAMKYTQCKGLLGIRGNPKDDHFFCIRTKQNSPNSFR